jgi:outer membrane protein assembly factor BamB
VLTREATSREHIRGGSWLLDDVLVHLDGDGNEIERCSLLEAFERTDGYRNWVVESELPEGTDIFHTNSIEVDPEARRALLSIRSINVVAMLDLDAEEIVWGLKGPWRRQHEAQLEDGILLLFDNLGLREQSRVIEFNIATGAIPWSYTAPDFFTKGGGAQQRLPNGNVLISESEAGRIIEVTRDGDIVWEYVNPRVVENGRKKTLGIMRAVRVPHDFPVDWSHGTALHAAQGGGEEGE